MCYLWLLLHGIQLDFLLNLDLGSSLFLGHVSAVAFGHNVTFITRILHVHLLAEEPCTVLLEDGLLCREHVLKNYESLAPHSDIFSADDLKNGAVF